MVPSPRVPSAYCLVPLLFEGLQGTLPLHDAYPQRLQAPPVRVIFIPMVTKPRASCPPEVSRLVERFNQNKEHYKKASYNETQVRREFIDPLFEALGWDIGNRQGLPETQKEVIHEHSLKIEGSSKAPDYAFCIGRKPKFFVEAKKPSVSLKVQPEAAFQVRRYAWSAKLPLSILTDFEEFAVYDTRFEPKVSDSASHARVLYFTYQDFETQWEEIAKVFSKDAVLAGSFDQFAEEKKRRGATEVDEAFLETIREWREQLAKDIHKQNSLNERQLNGAVQAIIDRIIFLRICEDRGTEEYGRLEKLKKTPDTYAALFKLFRNADERYNSGLFHFRNERDRPSEPDTLAPKLKVSDRVLHSIIDALYYPSPYDFRVFPPDVLGQVYERFLGDVIVLSSAGKTVKIEQKPEVRKAGGVYYTPTYIVDYIVDHTVGAIVNGKKPHEVAGRTEKTFKPAKSENPIRVLDPACGSGSFLLGAYDFLLNWYHKQYIADPKRWTKGTEATIWRKATNDYRLTINERKRILLDHIYGVDIDRQAVEVTKLSLLLKCLEGEDSDTIANHLFHAKDRALPDLAGNIRCGNSLVGTDFYNRHRPNSFTFEERLRINAFDWDQEFRLAGGGSFDVVIGNPPYLSYSGRQAVVFDPPQLHGYIDERYEIGGWVTSHGLFIEQSARRLCRRLLGFIIPDQVGHLDGYESTRAALTQRLSPRDIRYWGENVFKGVTTPALTVVADKDWNSRTRLQFTTGITEETVINGGEKWTSKAQDDLLARISRGASTLGELVADPGVHTGNCSKKLIIELKGAKRTLPPILEGRLVSRYRCRRPTKGLDIKYQAADGEYFTIRPIERYLSARFVIRQTATHPIVGPRKYADYFRNTLLALYDPAPPLAAEYIVGLLNSRLLRYLYSIQVHEAGQKAFPQVKVRSLRALPMIFPKQGNKTDWAIHDEVVGHVHSMLRLSDRLDDQLTQDELRTLSQQLVHIDSALDELVYSLYGLKQEEITVIDAALGEEAAEPIDLD